MYAWVKKIQFYTNEGPHPFSRGDNFEIAENTLTKFKKYIDKILKSSPEPLNIYKASFGDEDSNLF